MGFLEIGGAGANIYRRVKITRRQGSAGLMALNADGFHSSDVGIGPTLEDSEISWTGDDFLNIHNKMKIVCRPAGIDGSSHSMAIIDPGSSFQELRPGDEILFYSLMPGVPHQANKFVQRGRVEGTRRIGNGPSDAALVKECEAAGTAMQSDPYDVKLVSTVAANLHKAAIYVVNFTQPMSAVKKYDLANFEQRSGAHFAVRRNHFHDSCGTGGRIIGKAINGTLQDNVAERFGGVHIYSEQQWLEGALGIRNVALINNTIVEARGGDPTHVDVMEGLHNISCRVTTFVSGGVTTHRANEC